jgi:transposase
MSPIKYYTHVRLQDDLRSLRYHMIQYALRNGIKPAARMFNTTPKTVRKWLNRWKRGLEDWMTDQRKLARQRPSRIPEDQKQKAVELKKEHPSWGSMRIKHEFGLTISDKAIRKIWKKEGLS